MEDEHFHRQFRGQPPGIDAAFMKLSELNSPNLDQNLEITKISSLPLIGENGKLQSCRIIRHDADGVRMASQICGNT